MKLMTEDGIDDMHALYQLCVCKRWSAFSHANGCNLFAYFPLYEEFSTSRIVHCLIPAILACIPVLAWEYGLVIMLF